MIDLRPYKKSLQLPITNPDATHEELLGKKKKKAPTNVPAAAATPPASSGVFGLLKSILPETKLKVASTATLSKDKSELIPAVQEPPIEAFQNPEPESVEKEEIPAAIDDKNLDLGGSDFSASTTESKVTQEIAELLAPPVEVSTASIMQREFVETEKPKEEPHQVVIMNSPPLKTESASSKPPPVLEAIDFGLEEPSEAKEKPADPPPSKKPEPAKSSTAVPFSEISSDQIFVDALGEKIDAALKNSIAKLESKLAKSSEKNVGVPPQEADLSPIAPKAPAVLDLSEAGHDLDKVLEGLGHAGEEHTFEVVKEPTPYVDDPGFEMHFDPEPAPDPEPTPELTPKLVLPEESEGRSKTKLVADTDTEIHFDTEPIVNLDASANVIPEAAPLPIAEETNTLAQPPVTEDINTLFNHAAQELESKDTLEVELSSAQFKAVKTEECELHFDLAMEELENPGGAKRYEQAEKEPESKVLPTSALEKELKDLEKAVSAPRLGLSKRKDDEFKLEADPTTADQGGSQAGAEQIENASVFRRSFAFLIDIAFITALALALTALLVFIEDLSIKTKLIAGEPLLISEILPISGHFISAFLLNLIAYPLISFYLLNSTLGYGFMGLKIVDEVGRKPSFFHCTVRATSFPLSFLLLGFLSALSGGKTLHDRLSKTLTCRA